MLRPVFLLLLLAASGARGQSAPLAERVVGNWANADSVAYPSFAEDGAEIVDTNGGALFAIVYMHLSLTDSLYTSTMVYWDHGELRGSEATWPYSAHDGQIHSAGQEPFGVQVLGDSLVLSQADSLEQRPEYVYTRTAPLTPPEALLGDWISQTLTDAAGVVFDLPFRFSADGTFVAGYSEPLAYRVLGPYLLIEETTFDDPETGAPTTAFRASRSEVEVGARSVTLQIGDEEPLVLYRQR